MTAFQAYGLHGMVHVTLPVPYEVGQGETPVRSATVYADEVQAVLDPPKDDAAGRALGSGWHVLLLRGGGTLVVRGDRWSLEQSVSRARAEVLAMMHPEPQRCTSCRRTL